MKCVPKEQNTTLKSTTVQWFITLSQSVYM